MNRRVFFKYLVALPFIPVVALVTKSSDIERSWQDAYSLEQDSFANSCKHLADLSASLNEIPQVDSALNAIKFSGDITC